MSRQKRQNAVALTEIAQKLEEISNKDTVKGMMTMVRFIFKFISNELRRGQRITTESLLDYIASIFETPGYPKHKEYNAECKTIARALRELSRKTGDGRNG